MFYFYLNIFLVKKQLCVLLLAFLLTGHMNAQENSHEQDLIITFAPLAMADIFDGPSLRLGAETKLNQNIALSLEGGAYLGYLNSTKINPNGFLARPSVKYYFDKQKPGKFIALEYQYKHQRFGFIDSIVMPSEDRIEKEYGMKRKIHSVVAKYGSLIPIGKKFMLEWHIGLGLRHIRSFNDLTTEENEGILTGEAGDCPIQEDIIRLTGTNIFPDFRAGVKIGYRIKL